MIRIVTDSTCEAPAAVLQHPAVTVVPLYVLFGKEALKDKVEISQEQIWQRLPTSNPLPTTSQPTPADFLAPFRAFTEAGDEVIAVVLSSRLSGTHNSAIQAKADLPWQPVDVVDSATTSVGLGIVVSEALRMAEAGVPRATIVATLESMRARVHFLFALDRKRGQPIASFGDSGRIDLRQGLGRPAEGLSVSASTPGVVFEDLLILPSSVPETLPGTPGHIRAFDVNTGKQRWVRDVGVKRERYFGDWVSCYLALDNDVDPGPIDAITALKRALA